MDKPTTKRLLATAGVPVAGGAVVDRKEFARDPAAAAARATADTGLPAFVKPGQHGSSVGAGPADTEAEVASRLAEALSHDPTAVVEPRLQGRELTVAVLETAPDFEPIALPVIEIESVGHAFFDYTAKYTPGHNIETCPAAIPEALASHVQALALTAHQALGCRGASRTDFIVTDSGPIALETNTLPGMTEQSLLPLAARTAGIPFPALVQHLLARALSD
jgi:D-alanine-D-alanine ligase